jgi:6-phosphogluconolactonase
LLQSLANSTLVYIGTYTGPRSAGIYLFRLQAPTSEIDQNITLAPLGLAAETPNPSFLEIDPQRRVLFAVNELADGKVSAFSMDASTGKLTLLNQQSALGGGPCHIVLDRQRRRALVANYGGGSVTVLPVAPDGRLGEASNFVQHGGRSVHPQRQRGPHAHCVTLDPAQRFAFVCDLGLDKVMAYRYDPGRGKLTPNDPPFTALKPGSGPRHMVFRPDGRFAYVINEMTSTVSAFAYDAQNGILREMQSVSTLPAHYEGPNSGAEIDVHPAGKFLYVSNRGHNSVVLFAIAQEQGTLTYIEDQGTGGQTPRHFGISPSGGYMVIANQGSDTLLACRIDPGTGRLKPSGTFAAAPSPVCVKFYEP